MAAVEEGEMGFEAAFDDCVFVGRGRSAAGDIDGGGRGGGGCGGEQKRRDVGWMLRRMAEAAVFPLPAGGGHRRRRWRRSGGGGLEKKESGQNGEFDGGVFLKFVGHMVFRIRRDGPCPDLGLKFLHG